MEDITNTPTLLSLSFVNLSSGYSNNETMLSNAFLKSDANYLSKCTALVNSIPITNTRGVNLFYINDLERAFMYNWLKLDKTNIDITITSIDDFLIPDIITQLDNTDIRLRSMYLNKYEFLLLFYIDCDYINDINITFAWDVDNKFIRSFKVTKIVISEISIAFKFYHDFRK